MDTVTKFARLFEGRTDYIGAEEGGCIRIWGDTGGDSGDDLYWYYQGHLTGSRPPLGIYPVIRHAKLGPGELIQQYEFAVKFGAVDIDDEDFPLALNIWKALHALNITAWVERSRSKGYHVWIFCEDWVPATLVRSTLQVACDVVGYRPKEIFPKQTELVDGSPGNYIRLPYPRSLPSEIWKPTGRYMLDLSNINEGGMLGVETWVQVAWDTRVPRHRLEQAASLAAPPKSRNRPPVLGPGTPAEEPDPTLVPAMGGLSYTIWKDGPLDGQDRSGTLFKLAHSLKKDGFTAEQAYSLVRYADARWGKFSERADGETRLWEILDRVYND